MTELIDLAREVLAQFIPGARANLRPLSGGHINDTFFVDVQDQALVLQRINGHVFRDPRQLTVNTALVTQWIRRQEPLVPVQLETLQGEPAAQDNQGNWWRITERLRDTTSFDQPPSADMVFAAAAGFGRFQWLLRDFPDLGRFTPAIPGFHDLDHRLKAYDQALSADPLHRSGSMHEVLDLIATVRSRLHQSQFDALPRRLIHADSKFNNVLFDAQQRLCAIVDLDTVMPNASVYDLGDLVRSAANNTREDETNIERVSLNLAFVRAAIAGYTQALEALLTSAERQQVKPACAYIALMLGVRFATDYLLGDPYFKTNRPQQNLDRARTQLRLATLLLELD